ncbi:MAG: 3-hydroxyacyl-ACP dehydratase FabZ family protein [Spirochaetia bacterium]
MDYDALLRQHRKKPLFTLDSLTPLAWGREEIKRILPHREPFLLIDRLTGVSFDREAIAGSRVISSDDPIFAGHFPGYPVYPGCLEVEMIGQLGLCLHYFLQSRSSAVPTEVQSPQVRATRIVGAYYLEPVLPGRDVALLAKKLEYDEYLATMIGQVVADGKVACAAIGEVCFL